ncbi:MAG: hypothetical protein K2I44_03130, partial [Muribaculaceae bacterium]|nr:hypothetical protein [Muribaculaceae bacterium]
MKKYNAEVRAGVELLWGALKVPKTVAEHCDSLSHLLYVDTVSIPLSLQVISRLTVETYNLTSENGKVDYHQIVVALNSCKKVPAFYDKFFLSSCIGLGKHKLANKDGEQAVAAFSLALKCVQHENNNGIYDSFYPQIYSNLAYASYLTGELRDAVVWQSKYVDGIAKENDIVTDEYIEALSVLAMFEKQAGMESEALSSYKSLCDKLRLIEKEESEEYSEAALSIAEIEKSDEAFENLINHLSETNDIFADALSAAINYYHTKSDKGKVLYCLDWILKAVECGNVECHSLSNFITYLNSYYVDTTYGSRFLKLAKNTCDKSVMADCAFLASTYAKCGDFSNAVNEANRVKNMADQLLEKKDDDIALSFPSV